MVCIEIQIKCKENFKKIKMCQNKNQINLISYYYVILNISTLKYNIYKQKNYKRNLGIKNIEK